MEIYYYHLINELSKKENVVLFTNCKNYKIKNCKILHVTSKIFFIRKFNLGNISLFITTFLQLIIHHRKISVIHLPCTSNSGFYGYFFPLVSKIFVITYIIQFHGGGMRPWKKYDGNKWLFKYASKIIGVSDTIKNEYEKRSNREIEVVLPLVPYKSSDKSKSDLKQQYGFSDDDQVIIMVGSVKPLKGNIWIYREFKSIEKDWLVKNKIKLLFVGKGSDSEKLSVMIKNDNMDDIVFLNDHVPNEQIHEIYNLATLYVMGSDFEGTPKSLIEALFHGLPIVATDVDGINLIINKNENGLLVQKNNNGEMASAIRKLIENPDLALELGEKAKETYSAKFNFQQVVNRLNEIYQETATTITIK